MTSSCSEDELHQASGQARQYGRAREENLEPDEDFIDQCLEQRVRDPGPNVSPSRILGVPMFVAEDCQRQSYSVECCGLLVEVVVVVRDLADLHRDFGVEVGRNLSRILGAIVLADRGDARRVHPRLHHESPAGQNGDRLDEGRVDTELRGHVYVVGG